ncbi:MFS transporter [Ectobacillus panaciterrae]|uniref:MFS transporter n=1 Tax=Ectobacillus panaciterrae TaxID=363872 RepID=UPI000409B102|nr:MFS transporter [Ectobacillus panaciterrae]
MNKQYTFWMMVSVVAISGLSQGMLLPAIAMIFEKQGISSSFNGLHATALYIGILIISPFLEKPMQRFGMKPIVLLGGFMVIVSLFFFTQTFSFWAWFILRFAIGVGDHMLHVGTQTWITTASEPGKVGKNVSIYGVFFGLGFAAGPYLASTVEYGLATPFIISTILCLLGWLLMLPTQNAYPEQAAPEHQAETSFIRYKKVLQFSWLALLAPFVYGLLEAMLNSNLPVYTMRNGLSVEQISFLLPAFSIGGIMTQVPLGITSDRFGRGKVLTWIFVLSSFIFLAVALWEQYYWVQFGLVLLSGMIVGSTFSMGLGFMTDLLPKYLLPAGNILCGIAFSLGSIIGPVFGGIFIENVKGVSFYISISILLTLVSIVYVSRSKQRAEQLVESKAENF